MMTSSSNSSHIYDSNEGEPSKSVDEDRCFKCYCCLFFSYIYYFCCYMPCQIYYND